MITKKIIKDEIEELKYSLSHGEAEIPSFWSCLWPGLIIFGWNVICAIISVDYNYIAGRYIFWVVVFPGAVGLIVLLGVASARSLFLSVPKSFRIQSIMYRFFSKKIATYALVYMMVIILLAIYNRVFNDSPFPFGFMVLFMTILFGIVMNLDVSRYQLSALTTLIESFKSGSKSD